MASRVGIPGDVPRNAGMRSVGGGAAVGTLLRYPPPAEFAEGERGPGAAVAFLRVRLWVPEGSELFYPSFRDTTL